MRNIITNRLIIRRFEETDWQDLYEYLSNEEVVKYEPYEAFSEHGRLLMRYSKQD